MFWSRILSFGFFFNKASCAVVMKSGNINFLEPSGPLQACKGTALPNI
jgi:hypothetical protein